MEFGGLMTFELQSQGACQEEKQVHLHPLFTFLGTDERTKAARKRPDCCLCEGLGCICPGWVWKERKEVQGDSFSLHTLSSEGARLRRGWGWLRLDSSPGLLKALTSGGLHGVQATSETKINTETMTATQGFPHRRG